MAEVQRVCGWLAVCCVALLASACASVAMKADAEVTGTAMYRERIALPQGSEFEATLVDVSRADAAAEVIGTVRLAAPAGPPIRFTIPYDPRRIDAARRYAVRARIVHQGRPLFTTDTHYPVLTQGAPATVDVLLRRASSGAAGSAPPAGRVVRLGMYTYAADAGWFTECATGRRIPVAQEGDNAALESAYTRSRRAPNEAMLATVEGRVEERMPMEGAARPTLIVDRFMTIKQGNCEAGSAASLENTYWKVMRIRGVPVSVGERQREPHLILHPADRRVTGHGGCNALVGGYKTEADQIKFTQMVGTMMACTSGMEQERAFHQALDTVVRWRIDGQRLELLDGKGSAVLEFESRYLR